MSENEKGVEGQKPKRQQFIGITKSATGGITVLEASTRKELAKGVAQCVGEGQEFVLAVRGKKLVAEEKKTVSFV